MGKGGGGSQTVHQAPNQTIIPDRNQVLSPGQRLTDDYLANNTTNQLAAWQAASPFQTTQLYPLANYQQTYMPLFHPQTYGSFYGSGYGAQNISQAQQPFGLQSAGRPYSPNQKQGGM